MHAAWASPSPPMQSRTEHGGIAERVTKEIGAVPLCLGATTAGRAGCVRHDELNCRSRPVEPLATRDRGQLSRHVARQMTNSS